MRIDQLSTPALLVERKRVERNTARMSQRALNQGVRLRPHVKTAKSEAVARLATQGHFGGITVSTVAEAEYFAARDFRDITYAVCVIPQRLDRLAALAANGVRLSLITDDAEVAKACGERARGKGVEFGMLVEVDCGEHRTGVEPASGALLEVAHAVHAAVGLRLAGVLTHGGHSYRASSVDEVRAVATQERVAAVTAAERLRDASLPCDVVSAGSTPTAVHAESFAGLTEIRPGVYVFFDLAQLALGSCEPGDLALSVLATVIGHQRKHGRLILDAGGLALSKDTSAPNAGYGWVFDVEGARRINDLTVASVHQEHGEVSGQIPFDELAVGSRVRVFPNHACMTAAAYGGYHVVEGDQVVETWERGGGW